MPRRMALVLAFALLLFSSSSAQEPKREKKVLKNADVVRMTQNEFDDETLLKIIQISDTDFDISSDALIELKNQGVSHAVIRAMLEAAAQKKLSADADASANPNSPNAQASTAANDPADTASAPSAPADKSAAADQPATARASTNKVTADENTPGTKLGSASATTPPPSAPTAATAETAKVAADRSSSPVPSAPSSAPSPAAPVATPAPASPMASMGANPQMAMVQSQLAMMGLGGLAGMFGASSPASYSPEQLPHVFLMDPQIHHEKHEFPPSMAQIAQTKFKSGAPSPGGMALRELATEGLSFAAMAGGPGGMMAMSAFSAASGFMPGMRPGTPSMTYVWGLPGRQSARKLTDPDPIFQLNYGDIPGVDPDAFEPAILHLVQTPDNYRLVGATRTKLNPRNMMSGAGPENGKWLAEDRWPTRIYKEERGFYVLRVDKPLEPGEYAVVLRPVKGYKAAPSGLGGHAQVFYSVWDFSVPGATPEVPKKKKK
ncbi:MAG TPA: hypothetical protein VE077_06525 [Candidatus Methylomirabilis sp.]|nr:hypothetical protein [Candidatus Methylomirabilis sp.]